VEFYKNQTPTRNQHGLGLVGGDSL